MNKKKRRLKKTVKQKIRIFLVTLIVTITGLSYSLIADADNDKNNTYPAYQNTVDIDTQSNGKISLSVTAEEHTLPEDTKISLKEITDIESEDYKKIQEQLNKNAEDDNVQISGSLIYELSLTDADDNPIESVNDNKIHVYTSYETHATPLTENNNEEISLKYLSNDSSYALTEPSDDDPVTINTDDNNAITDLSMDVHGSTYYALVWSKKPEITEHAVDADGNELIDSNTLQVSEETDVNTLAAAIDGYTLTSVTADNTDITAVKAEKGKLYFNNGQDWTEASDDNVWFHYAPVEVSEDTDADVPASEPVTEEDTDTEEVTEPETEETPVQEETDTDKQLTASTKDNKYTVTVTYGEDAGLPEGTKLSLTSIDSKEEKYADAKKAVASDKNVKTNTLGMEALDITLTDSKGNKVEPDSKSSVQVSISVNDLPDDVNSVDIHHITEEDTSNDSVTDTITRGIRRMGRIFSNNIAVNHDKASAVAKNVSVTNNTANAEFNVNSFSTFTITWTTTNGESTARIAQVKLHYVDEDGNELADPTERPASTITSGTGSDQGKVAVTDWVKSVTGYDYKEARLSSSSGTVITNIQANGTTSDSGTTYTLKYSTDGTTYTNVPDAAVTGAKRNTVDVYLIYKSVPHFTVHYVTKDGTELQDPVIKYGNDLTSGTGADVSAWSQKSITNDNTPYYREGTHLGSASGKSISSVHAVKDEAANTYTLQYKRTSGDADWSTAEQSKNNVDLYVVYKKEPHFTLHYVDDAGKEIASVSSETKYASSFTNTVTIAGSDWIQTIDGYTFVNAHLDNYMGAVVTDVQAVDNGTSYDLQVKKQVSDGQTAVFENTSSTDLYFVYKKDTSGNGIINVHYMDIGGEPITDESGNALVRAIDISGSTSQIDLATSSDFAISIPGYTFSSTNNFNNTQATQNTGGIIVINYDNQPLTNSTKTANINRGSVKGTNFRRVTYTSDASKTFTLAGAANGTAIKNGDGSIDVYMLYVPTLTVHYVDAVGNTLYPDYVTNKSIQWGNNIEANNAELSSYSNGHGTPSHIYAVKPGSSAELKDITTLAWGNNGNTTNDDVNTNHNWQTTLTFSDSSTTTENSLIKDIYMVYDKTITVHHIDENGNQIASVTRVGVSSGNEMSASSFANRFSGYVFDGAYFADPNTDTTAKSFSSVTYTKNGDSWTCSATLSNDNTDNTNHDDVWVVYNAASVTDVNKGITVHYVDEDGNTVAADKVVSTSSWSSNASARSWGWGGAQFITNGAVSNNYLQSNPSLGQPMSVYLGTKADNRPFTLTRGTNQALLYKFDSATGWQTGIGTTASGSNVKPTSESTTYKGLIMDLTFVYPSKLNVTVHHVDTTGKKIANDTTFSVQSSDTAVKALNTFQISITNYTASSMKFGSDFSTASNITTGISFSKTDGSWNYTIDSRSAQTIDNSAEIYVVYSENLDSKNLIIHFVDDTGKSLATPFSIGNKISKPDSSKWIGTTPSRWGTINYSSLSSQGYVFKGEYLGPDFNTDSTKLVNNKADGSNQVQWYWNSESNQWYTSHNTNDSTHYELTDPQVFEGFITDIYWVFTKPDNPNSNTLTQHYGYMSNNDNSTTEFNEFTSTQLSTEPNDSTNYPSTLDGLNETEQSVVPTESGKTIKVGDDTYTYAGTYVATASNQTTTVNSVTYRTNTNYNNLTAEALKVTAVRLKDGKKQYLVDSISDKDLSMTRRNRWNYTSESGRSLTLKNENGNLSLIDTQVGNTSIDLLLSSSEGSTNTYTAVSGSYETGTVYTVTEKIADNRSKSYKILVSQWTENTQTGLYHVYTKKTDTSNATVRIEDDVMYSGNLVAETDSTLPEGAQIVSYTWYKSINGGEYKEVSRNQNGTEWNLEHELRNRSYLDLAADEGEMSLNNTNPADNRTSVKYKVKLTYSVGDSNVDVTSGEFTVPYYDQLENGSFEDVPAPHNSNMQPSNAEYKEKGIWQTTGLGANSTKASVRPGQDIEIVNTDVSVGESAWYQQAYGWPTYNANNKGPAYGKDTPDGKSQFAELNCETAGALYQDVLTHQNEYLNYWLSHRARGTGRIGTKVYDTMYLVIMPTALAMTSGTVDNPGGELRTQTDLAAFINSHGGFNYNQVNTSNAEEDPLTTPDSVIYNQDGIYIARITSDDEDWHSITVANAYRATSSLTRFFFAAGPTSTSDNTMGNLVDAVGFSQKLQTPATPHFHVVVKKTFSGLTASDIANLVNGKSEDQKFKLTINEYSDAEGTQKDTSTTYETDESRVRHTSLNGAVLSFNADASNNFTLTAETTDPNDSSKKVSILDGVTSTGLVTEDADTGDVTMTWTLYNNYIDTTVPNRYFKITESNANLNGFSTTASNSGNVEHGAATAVEKVTDLGNANGSVTNTIHIVDQDTANVNFTNEYRDNSSDDHDHITVTKTFTGITPTVVSDMMGGSSPYKLTVTNSNNSSLVLLGNETKPFEGSYPEGVGSVTLVPTRNEDGSTTLTWTITGTTEDGETSWVNSNPYTVKEENYSSSNRGVTDIKLNDSSVGVERVNKIEWPETDPSVQVGQTSPTRNGDKIPTITVNSSGNVISSTLPTIESPAELDANTNLIVAKYTDSSNVNYLVWTPQTVGVNVKQAIINYIKRLDGFSASGADNNLLHFRSGEDPGSITVGSGAFYYDGTDHKLGFSNASTPAQLTWDSYYAAHYSLTENTAGETEIRVKNSYEPAIRIMKVDADNNDKLLGNARFRLYKDDSGKQYLTSETDASASNWNTDAANAHTFTTASETTTGENAQTLGVVSLPLLPAGTYYLEETNSPPGYNMPTSNPVAKIIVSDDGLVKVVKGDNNTPVYSSNKTGDDIAWCDWNSPYYTITVSDKPGILLPITGGHGVYLFYIAGALIIAIAGVLHAKKKLNEKQSNT